MLARGDDSFRYAAEDRTASQQAHQVSHGCKSNAGRADPDASALQQISQLCESRTGNRKIRVLRPQQHSHEECAEGCSGYIPGYGEEINICQTSFSEDVWHFIFRLYFAAKISYSFIIKILLESDIFFLFSVSIGVRR